ncbi:hypothetical protein INP57_19730 [Saccharopolyspora sp. HNM0986]|uniref:hypothetical protein n=1 Tax=Saccharopolyspora galaxeae TaxID=2781241 RepID=UPI00190B5FE2|nr:hypothetical protein [Saccharopolyspora sp. HNM0986]MBK0869042.1 hypothetical protein [Saccharopolyspora sp. HNM0986]
MPGESWRRPVDGLVYCVQFAEELTDELAAREAQRFLAEPYVTLTQQEQYDALAYAVANGADLGANIPQPHSDETLRMFLSKVVAEMDRQRPWTPPPLQLLPLNRWSDFTDAAPVARLTMSPLKAEERLRQPFSPAPDDGRDICPLALVSGTEIVLVANYWPETGAMALLTHDTEPQQVIKYLLANTDLTESELTPV